MRLVVSALEQDGEEGAESLQSMQKQEEAVTDVTRDTEHKPEDGNVIVADVSEEVNAETDTKQNSDFVDTATKLLLNHISDSEFNIDRLCREMAMSRTMFYVKLKSYTGKSPQEFIRVVRLERAAVLLRAGHHVGDVAGEVGYDNAKYFSTSFKKYFGVSPSKYK